MFTVILMALIKRRQFLSSGVKLQCKILNDQVYIFYKMFSVIKLKRIAASHWVIWEQHIAIYEIVKFILTTASSFCTREAIFIKAFLPLYICIKHKVWTLIVSIFIDLNFLISIFALFSWLPRVLTQFSCLLQINYIIH